MKQFNKNSKQNRILTCLLIICLMLSSLSVWADNETLPSVGTPTGAFEEESTEPVEAESEVNTEVDETEDSSEPQETTERVIEEIVIDPELAAVYDYLKFKEEQVADQQVIDVINEHTDNGPQETTNYESELLRSMRLRKQEELNELKSIVYRSNGYVNVRSEANAEASVVGRMRHNSTALILDVVYGDDGTWYHIESGPVTGYVKAEFFVSGYEAVEIISSLTLGYVSVLNDAQRLYRYENTDSDTLATLYSGPKYQLVSWNDNFVQILYAQGELGTVYGYVPRDNVTISWEAPKAVTIEEEQRSLTESNRIIYEMSSVDRSREESLLESSREAAALALQQSIEESIRDSEAAYEAWLIASRKAEEASIKAVEDESRRVAESLWADEQSRIAESSWLRAREEALAESSRQAAAAAAAAEASRQAAAQAAAVEASRQAETQASREAQQAQNVINNSWYIPENTSDLRRRIVTNALQYVGVLDYIFGGYSLSSGTDCSGFLSLIYAQYGVELAHYSYYIARTGVKVMSIDQARPGDIVCWRTWDAGAGQGHVAMYIGRNAEGTPMIVEAPREGLKVRVIEMPTEGFHTIQNVLGD